MRPTLLVARNFRTYPELELQLPDGLVAIVGELRGVSDGADSNGAGKSSILEAIDIALFGRRSLAPFLTRGLVDAVLLLELEFEHAGGVYRVRRTYSPRGRGKPSCDFEELGDGGWLPLTCASIKETDQLICRTVGLTRDTYRNSSYLRQGDGSFADPSRDPRERRDLLAAAVFGHDPVWPQLMEQARAERRLIESSLEQLDGRAQAARELVAQKAGVTGERGRVVEAETELADQVADLEREHGQLAERYQAAREQASLRQAAQAELAAATATLDRLTLLETAARDADTQITAARHELTTLSSTVDTDALIGRERELLAVISRIERETAEHRAAVAQVRDAEARQASLTRLAGEQDANAARVRAAIVALEVAVEARCDRCEQVLHANARKIAIASMEKEADEYAADADRLRSEAAAIAVPDVPAAPTADPPAAELAAVRARLAAAQRQLQQRVRLEERIVQLQRTVDARPTIDMIESAKALTAAKQQALEELQPVDIDELTRQGTLAKQRLDMARGQLERQRTLKARLDERLAQIADAESQLAEVGRESKTLHASVDVVGQLERAYAPAGIPTLILENTALPAIETEANRILDLLGCPYQLELRTQAEKKDGTGLKETLDVVVIDPQGDEAAFEECASGGEKTRIGLALRIALARLLLHRRGAESRILCLDEPSYLDEAGMRALLGVLVELQADFDTILLVSHVAELRDSFDTTLTVIRDGATSRVEGASVFEAAAA